MIEILTPSGFQQFEGITKTCREILYVRFSDESYIKCTPEHKIKTTLGWKSAKELKPNTIIDGNKHVVKIQLCDFPEMVYDLVNVSNGNAYITNKVISHNCSFIGSSYSLVDGNKMSGLATIKPILEKDKLNFFEEPKKDHPYIITVDTSRGQHLDHSAFVVFDISQRPYKVVATFKDNQISPESYPYLIYTTAKQYNNAYVLIEVNDLGEMVASNLFHEFEYENVYFTFKDELNEGRGYPGVRTTKKVKAVGCSTLKGLIEEDQLLLNSHQILEELGIFVQKGASYAAEDESINDDLMTCLWLFAWLTKQPIFSDLTSTNIRAILASNMERYIDETMTPFGFRDDGMEEANRKEGELDLSRFGGEGDPFLKWVLS